MEELALCKETGFATCRAVQWIKQHNPFTKKKKKIILHSKMGSFLDQNADVYSILIIFQG